MVAARTVPVSATKASGQLITGALWQAGPYATADFLLGPPTFRGHQATPISMVSGVLYAMTFDVTDIDTEGGHSNTVNPSRYTCQVPGWYWVEGYLAVNNTAGQARFESFIAKNGTTVPGASQFLSCFRDLQALQAAALVQLAGGDIVEVWGRQNTGSTISTADGTDLCPSMNLLWLHA